MFCQPELEALLEPAGRVAAHRSTSAAASRSTRSSSTTTTSWSAASVGLARRQPQLATAPSAGYVVGCDGANSTVRDLLGVTIDDRGFFYDWLIVDVILDEPRVFDPINLQICDPARPTTAVSGGPGRRRWEFMRLPDETLEELNEESRAGSCSRRGTCTPATPASNATPSTRSRPAYAEQWQVGRVFLAGDAAHQMPPFAGPGHVRRHPRRRQPRVEARPRARRPGRAGLLATLRGGAAPERGRRDRLLDGARQGDLRARPGRGGGARRRDGRRRRPASVSRGARPARDRERARRSPVAPHAGELFPQGDRRRPAGSTTCTAPAGASSPSIPTPADLDPALRRLVRARSAAPWSTSAARAG